MYNAVKKYGSDIALSTNVRVGNGVTKKRLNLKTEKVYTQLQDKFDVSNIIKNPCPTNKIYLKEFLEKYEIKFPESVYCEDKLFCCKAIFYANALVTVPENYYYYYRNPLSTVNTVSKKHIADKKQAKKDVFEFLKNQKANIRDKNLWQEKYSFKIGKIPLFEKREYLFSEKYILFGLIKIFEKKRVN